MTISLAIKVNDGIVLASDSASTIYTLDTPSGEERVFNVYDNANKIFNIIKGEPIGAITWGAGSIGSASIETLAKDFRETLVDVGSGTDLTYTVQEIAGRFKRFIYDEHYAPEFESWPQKPPLGFLIAGYSVEQGVCVPGAELWQIAIEERASPDPRLIHGHESVGISWYGEIEPIGRLVKGFSSFLPSVLERLGLDDITLRTIIDACNAELEVPLVVPPMPIRDAIDLATFLVEMTEQYAKFLPGPNTVAGPIEIGTITKHERFRWIKRKHYYPRELNR